jgi:hypothetical protein
MKLSISRYPISRARRITALDKGLISSATRGRCYDHNFLRFSTFFGEKIGVFLKKNVMIKILRDLALF